MTTITMKEVAAFLLGEASLDGYWFGERHPISPFWWREHLRAALSAPATAPEQPASKALQDVATERQRQDAKWGGPEHDDTHPISDWQRFISQRAENLVYRGNPERMYELFIEIAALAVAAAESIDRKGTP